MKKYKVRGLGKMCFQDYVIQKLNLMLDRIREGEKERIKQRNTLEEIFLAIEEIKRSLNEKV